VVELQQRMNRLTFQRLLELGLSPDHELNLDFAFVADDEESLRALSKYLTLETDYELVVGVSDGAWSLTGTTQPTQVTLEILDKWVEWMAHAGVSHRCEFDGWGTSI
jgi:regulator of RNase E activity RraB